MEDDREVVSSVRMSDDGDDMLRADITVYSNGDCKLQCYFRDPRYNEGYCLMETTDWLDFDAAYQLASEWCYDPAMVSMTRKVNRDITKWRDNHV